MENFESVLNLLKQKGFDMKPCQHGAYHYYRDEIGIVQVYPPGDPYGCSIGYHDGKDWVWEYSNDIIEIEGYIDTAISETTKE